MAYYFECETCRTKEVFSIPTYSEEKVHFHKAKKQDYETVICSSCVSSKTRLKGNYIIIEKGNK